MTKKPLTDVEREERKEEFEHWLIEMDDALDRFLSNFSSEERARLDFTPDSLDVVEALILERYDAPETLLESSQNEMLDGLARYVGETFRRRLGGRWGIRLDDPKYVYFGLPQLEKFSEKSTPICPLTLVTAATDRRKGTYLRTVLNNASKRL